MEENIKILEELIDKKYTKNLLEIVSVFTEKDKVSVLSEKEKQAIENLISRYKELEEEKEECIEALEEWINGERISEYSIPKSKVKEKIEEIDKQGNTPHVKNMAYTTKKGDWIYKEHAIKILQELLEES